MKRILFGLMTLVWMTALGSGCGAYAWLKVDDAQAELNADATITVAVRTTCEHNTPNVTCEDDYERLCVTTRFLDASAEPAAELDVVESCSTDVPKKNGDFTTVVLTSTVPIVVPSASKSDGLASNRRVDGASPIRIEIGLTPEGTDFVIDSL